MLEGYFVISNKNCGEIM